jgi:hypothetical protein
MAYNKIVYRVNYLGEKIYCNIDETPKTDHIIELVCDECGIRWDANTSNWFIRKKRKSYVGDFCGSCTRSGVRNPAFGKKPCRHMSQDDINNLRNKQRKSSSGENNAMYGRHHSPETRALQSKSKVDLISEGNFDIRSCNRGRKAYYVSIKSNIQFHADSILELARMIELDNDIDVISWTKYHGIKIPYIFEDKNYNYVPDFLIEFKSGEKMIEETKGRIIPRDIEKQRACKIFCESNNYRYRMFMGSDLNDLSSYKRLLKEIK